MRKLWNRVLFCLLLSALVWTGTLLADRSILQENLIRLHVVANSDSVEDQAIKLQVRDAVMDSLAEAMSGISDVEAAKTYLRENLPKIAHIANTALREAGYDGEAAVAFCEEAFGKREYDTFTLPSGVYHALRIIIGEGQGKNWWCVVFPTLCLPDSSKEFVDTAAGAGFSDSLSGSLTGEYEIRFFLLDAMGHLENIFFPG